MKNSFLIYPMMLLIVLNLWFPASVRAQTKWVTFRNPQFKFHFIHPPDWQVGTPTNPNNRGTILSPKGKPVANCFVIVKSSPETSRYSQMVINKNLDSKTWSENEWMDSFYEHSPGLTIKIVERKRIRINNRPGQYAVYTAPFDQGKKRLYLKQMYFVSASPGYSWHIACSGAARTEDEAVSSYEYWKPVFSKIFSSFVFEK